MKEKVNGLGCPSLMAPAVSVYVSKVHGPSVKEALISSANHNQRQFQTPASTASVQKQPSGTSNTKR